jgi:uncharacterized protein (DUF1778 family)
MTTKSISDARLNFRLPADLKQAVEEAAALTGQTVSDYAVSVLVQNARALIQQHENTVLTNRDRDAFIRLLDEAEARPNEALLAAAKDYKKRLARKQ